MASITGVLERLRSRAPVTVFTPLGLLWLSGIVVSVSTDTYGTHADFGTFILTLALDVVAGAAVLSFVDRLFRMRAAESSWWIFGSLTFFSVLSSLGPISLLFDNSNRDYAAAYAYTVLSAMLAYLSLRELTWLLRSRRSRPLVSTV